MPHEPHQDLQDVIRRLGKYPPSAFEFIQQGLVYSVQQTHGDLPEDHKLVHEFMDQQGLTLSQLEDLYSEDRLPEEIHDLIDRAGGLDPLNRHVSGEKLCWGLRDYALSRWGAMASTVLNQWHINGTRDFGEIVFALVENEFLQKEPEDKIEDFDEVFSFDEALDQSFRIPTDSC